MDDCVKKDVIYYSVKKIAALLLGLRQLNVVMSKIANELTLLAIVLTISMTYPTTRRLNF